MFAAASAQVASPASSFAMVSSRAACSSAAAACGSSRTGIWSQEEHDRFLDAMQKFPKGPWKAIAAHIQTRSVRQVQTHAQKYQEKVERRIRGLRKRKKKIVRTEHRLLANHVELCEIMAESEQITPLPLSPKRSASAANLSEGEEDKSESKNNHKKLKDSSSSVSSPTNCATVNAAVSPCASSASTSTASSAASSPCGSPRSPSSSSTNQPVKIEPTASDLIPLCFSPTNSGMAIHSDNAEDASFAHLFNSTNGAATTCAAAAASCSSNKKMVPLPSFGESLDFLIELFSNTDPLVMV